MSSSSASTEAVNPDVPAAPIGWTRDKAYMYESYYWLGVPGDTKSMLSMDYGLADAKPIWTQTPRFGNILYIFEAPPSVGKTSYYVWNAIESSVCFIDVAGIDEIRETLNKFGRGRVPCGG